MDCRYSHKQSEAKNDSAKHLKPSPKIELGGRLFFDIWNPCFAKDTFNKILCIIIKPDSHIILQRLIELKGNSSVLDFISVYDVPDEIKRLCEDFFICKNGLLPNRKTVTNDDLPLLSKSYDAIFLDYHVWPDTPREIIDNSLIFLRFHAPNIYSINSSFTIIDYHDFEWLYIETELKETKISAYGIIRPECCEELYQSAKAYGRKGTILNIGTYLGRSAIALALGSKKVGGGKIIAIDPIIPAEFYENIRKNSVSDYIIPLQMSSREAYVYLSNLIKDGLENKMGLIFVDGAHCYEEVFFDLSNWKNHLVPGGLLLVDDYERAEPGIMRAVYEQIICSGKFASISMPIDRLIRAEKN